MVNGRNQIKETLSNCFGVLKSSPPLLSVLVYVEFYIAFMICLFSIVGYSMGEPTLTVLLMAGLQTVIAVPGYLYMMWNEPKYLLVFALVQVAAFCTEFLWAIVLLFGHGFDGKSGLLMSLSVLQLTNVIVSFFFRDLRVDFCCCGKNRRASGQNSVSLENGLTPPPANWAKTSSPNRYSTETNPAPSLSTSEKVAEAKKARKSTMKNALRRKNNVGFEVEEKPSKNGTAHSPLEKNIFGGISEEEKERAMQKRLSRLPAHTPSRSMTKSPGEVRVGPGSSSSSSRRVAPKKAASVPQKAARPMTGSGSRSKEGTPSKEGSGSRERTSSESLRQTSVTIK